MSPLEPCLLQACSGVVHHQAEMAPRLAEAVRLPTNRLLYWQLHRVRQSGRLPRSEWAYFFHGASCDLRDTVDGRLLRIDFGPGSALDTLTSWSVLQYVQTATAPWRAFPLLREAIADLGALWERLAMRGLITITRPDLIAFRENHSSIGPDGITHVRYPDDVSDETVIDCSVASRWQVSPAGWAVLARQAAAPTADRMVGPWLTPPSTADTAPSPP